MGYSVLQNAQLHTVVYCESRVTPSCQSRAHNPFHPSRCTFQTCWCYKSCFENLQYMPFKKCDARASFEPQSTILPLSLSLSHTHTHTHTHTPCLSRFVGLSPSPQDFLAPRLPPFVSPFPVRSPSSRSSITTRGLLSSGRAHDRYQRSPEFEFRGSCKLTRVIILRWNSSAGLTFVPHIRFYTAKSAFLHQGVSSPRRIVTPKGSQHPR